MDIEKRIYNILYANSSVDGVRILFEDQWPIEEIKDLIEEIRKEYEKENLENTASELLKDIPNLALIWGDGTGKDEDMVENSKAFGLHLIIRFKNRHSK